MVGCILKGLDYCLNLFDGDLFVDICSSLKTRCRLWGLDHCLLHLCFVVALTYLDMTILISNTKRPQIVINTVFVEVLPLYVLCEVAVFKVALPTVDADWVSARRYSPWASWWPLLTIWHHSVFVNIISLIKADLKNLRSFLSYCEIAL